MSETETEGGRLFRLYARYVGEPDSVKDVYGYWLFLFGALVAFLGIIVYLLRPQGGQFLNTFVQVAYVMAATGLPLALLGIVLLLPVQRWSIGVSVLGTLVALAGVGWFIQAFPANWPPVNPGVTDLSPQIIGVYTAGVALIASVAVLVPVFTGEKSLFFREQYERSREYPPVEVGEAFHGGMFSVYKGSEEWTWRLVEETAVAGSVENYLSRLESEESVERIKEKVEEAGLLEIKHAAFRLYEAAEGTWRWVLMRDDGSVVANSEDEFGSRNDTAEAVNELKERGPGAEIIEIEEGGAFDFVERGSTVHWRLVDDQRNVLGEGPTGYGERAAAENALESARAVSPDARTLAVETFGVELFEPGENETAIEVFDDDAAAADPDLEAAANPGSWRWRLVDPADAALAVNQDGFDSRRSVEERVYDLLDALPAAPVLAGDQPGYEVAPSGEAGWDWRLLDGTETIVARSHGGPTSQAAAEHGAETMKHHAPDADVVSIEGADFEYYRTDEGWHWRLVTESRDEIARSTEPFGSKQAAAAAIEDVREMARKADLIEFENAAFQLYEHAGEWRWRLIDEDGNVMADSGEEHDSRESAAASMMTIKEQAPDAEVLEVESAAFELFNDEDGNWNWRLVDIAGETVAHGPDMVGSREEARENMDRLTDTADVGDIRAMEAAIFQVYADESDDWQWRFVHPDGSVIADGERTYPTRDEAATAIDEEVQPAAARGPVQVVESVALQVDVRGDRYTWRLLDAERETLAASTRSYAGRDEVTTLLEQLQRGASDVTVFELRDYAFHVRQREDGWDWRLVDDGREPLMTSPETYASIEAARSVVDHIKDVIEEAGIVDFDDAAFEIFQDEDRWRWQLIDEAENVMARGAQDYGTREDVEEAIESIRGELDDASILEIDIAAFELTESDGEWRWRLIDETGNPVAQSLRPYESRREARETMEVLKEYGPDALTQVAE